MIEPYDCEHGNSCYTCKDCTIRELTAQLADMTALYHTNSRCECGDDEACQHVRRIQELEQALERIANDYDCDEDAHKYSNGNGCRCCDAAKALGRG